MDDRLTVTTYPDHGWTVVHVAGELDLHSAPHLRETFLQLTTDGQLRLIVDLDAVEFIDSTALSILVIAHKRLRAHDGTLSVVCTADRVLKVLRLTGLSSLLNVQHSIAAAIIPAAAVDDAPAGAQEHPVPVRA